MMKLVLALVVLLPFVIILIKNPFVGLWLMIFLNPMVTLFKISTNTSILKLLGYILLLGWVVNVSLRNKKIRLGPYYHYIFIFLAWSMLSLLWSVYYPASFSKAFLLAQLIIFYFIFYNLSDSLNRLDSLLIAHILGSSIAVLIGFHQFLTTGKNIMHYRMSISGLNENSFGVNCAIAMIGLMYIIIKERFVGSKIFSWSLLILNTFGFYFSGSRGAWIAVFISVLVFVYQYNKEKPGNATKRIISFSFYIIVVGIVFILSWFLISHFFPLQAYFLKNRFIEALHPKAGDPVMTRFEIWWLGINIFLDKLNFIFGVGLGAFPYATLSYYHKFYDPHSVFIGVLTELGIFGFFLWLMILTKLFILIKKNRDPSLKSLTFSIWVLALIVSAKASFLWGRECWMLIAFITSAYTISLHRITNAGETKLT